MKLFSTAIVASVLGAGLALGVDRIFHPTSITTLRDVQDDIHSELRENSRQLAAWLARGESLGNRRNSLQRANEGLASAADEEEKRFDRAADAARRN